MTFFSTKFEQIYDYFRSKTEIRTKGSKTDLEKFFYGIGNGWGVGVGFFFWGGGGGEGKSDYKDCFRSLKHIL